MLFGSVAGLVVRFGSGWRCRKDRKIPPSDNFGSCHGNVTGDGHFHERRSVRVESAFKRGSDLILGLYLGCDFKAERLCQSGKIDRIRMPAIGLVIEL